MESGAVEKEEVACWRILGRSFRLRAARMRNNEGRRLVAKVIEAPYTQGARDAEKVLAVPSVVSKAPGIVMQGRRIRSLVFSTDLAVICHCNADAVLAVYPFTCQPAITQALVGVSQRPVLCGVGGSITQGERCIEVALHSEMQGVAAVVVNTSIPLDTLRGLVERVTVPVVVTVCAADEVAERQIEAGVTMVNVAAGAHTAEVVHVLRGRYPELPIIATGGPDGASIERTIAAGADVISWTPPDIRVLERAVMEKARCLAKTQL